MSNIKDYVNVCVFSIMGFIEGTLTAQISVSKESTAKTYVHEDRGVIRDNRSWEADAIYIEQERGNGEYITLKKYLDNFENKHDRDIEKAKIEKLIDW